MMDVLSRTIYKNIEGICATKGKSKRMHGRRMACTRIMCMDFYKYMECLDKSMPKLWSTKDNDTLVGKVQQGKGI